MNPSHLWNFAPGASAHTVVLCHKKSRTHRTVFFGRDFQGGGTHTWLNRDYHHIGTQTTQTLDRRDIGFILRVCFCVWGWPYGWMANQMSRWVDECVKEQRGKQRREVTLLFFFSLLSPRCSNHKYISTSAAWLPTEPFFLPSSPCLLIKYFYTMGSFQWQAVQKAGEFG